MIFDTHIHLNDEKLFNNLDAYLSDAKKKGVNKFLCVGWDVESSRKAVEIANKYNGVYAAIAVMPTSHETYNENSIFELEEIAKNNKVVAIGEIGLDYYWEKTTEVKAKQKEMFIEQIRLANKLNLPISIHCRDAIQDCFDIIKMFPVKRKSVMHCYQGSLEMAREFIKNNFVIAFGGTVTFKNSKNAQNVFDNLDLENIVFETDAPYLSPTPHRGEINIPEYIYDTVKYCADRKGLDQSKLEEITYKTSCDIFLNGKEN